MNFGLCSEMPFVSPLLVPLLAGGRGIAFAGMCASVPPTQPLGADVLAEAAPEAAVPTLHAAMRSRGDGLLRRLQTGEKESERLTLRRDWRL